MLEKDTEKSARSNKVVTVHNKALLSGVAYCISSCSMILVNKYVLSSYDFNAGISLMLYQVLPKLCYIFELSRYIGWVVTINLWSFMQNFVSVVVVSTLRLFGVISTEPLTWKLVKVWLPVNVIFVGMLITSMFRYKILPRHICCTMHFIFWICLLFYFLLVAQVIHWALLCWNLEVHLWCTVLWEQFVDVIESAGPLCKIIFHGNSLLSIGIFEYAYCFIFCWLHK